MTVLTLALALIAGQAVDPTPRPTPPLERPGDRSTTVEQAMARAFRDALPEARYPWRLNWSAFGVPGGRDIHWRLHPPQPYEPVPLPEGLHRRTGWLNVDGRTVAVAVCGDVEQVGGLSISVPDLWAGEGDVIQELEARGVAARLIVLREAEPPEDPVWGRVGDYYLDLLRQQPGLREWRLEAADREPARLISVRRCTHPGMKSGSRCWMVWTLSFRPDDPPRPGADCPLPGRDGGG